MSRPESSLIPRKFKLPKRTITGRHGAKAPKPFTHRPKPQKTGRNCPITPMQRHFQCRGQVTLMAFIREPFFPCTPITSRGIGWSGGTKARQMAPRAGVTFIIRRMGCHHRNPWRHRHGLRPPLPKAFDVKGSLLIRDDQIEGAPGSGIKPGDGIRCCFGGVRVGCHQRQLTTAPFARRGAKAAGAVEGGRQHTLGAKRHPGAACAAVPSTEHAGIIRPPSCWPIPSAVHSFIPVRGNQHRPFMAGPVQQN